MVVEIDPLDPDALRVSAVLPVFSETNSVRETVHALARLLGTRLTEIILVVADRSSPESRSVCAELAQDDSRIRVLDQRDNPGVGRAYREGLAATTGDPVLTIDSDGEMEVDKVPAMLDLMLRSNLALVVGSRWGEGGGFEGYGKLKYVLNWGFQKLFQAAFRTKIRDLTYGFKLMRAKLARDVEWSSTLHEIGCETTLRPIRAGYPAGQVGTKWRARVAGKSTNNPWRNFRYVAMALRILSGPAAAVRAGVPARWTSAQRSSSRAGRIVT